MTWSMSRLARETATFSVPVSEAAMPHVAQSGVGESPIKTGYVSSAGSKSTSSTRSPSASLPADGHDAADASSKNRENESLGPGPGLYQPHRTTGCRMKKTLTENRDRRPSPQIDRPQRLLNNLLGLMGCSNARRVAVRVAGRSSFGNEGNPHAHRFATASHVGHERQRSQLKDFIAEALPRRRAAQVGRRRTHYTLVVRDPDSPAAQPLLRCLLRTCRAGIARQSDIARTETQCRRSVAASLLDISCVEFRMLGDPRFGAAHEQLVARHDTSGLAIACAAIRTSAMLSKCTMRTTPRRRPRRGVSFDKLWAAAKPVSRVRRRGARTCHRGQPKPPTPTRAPRNQRH